MGMVIQRRRRSKKRRRESKAREIPMDVVTGEILTRLPAKSLMKFKCVSKLWASVISSRYFSNRFLTVPSAPRLYMSLVESITGSHKSETLALAPDTATPSSFVVEHNVTFPQRCRFIFQNLNGFLCYDFWGKPRLFNPATRQLVTLPAIKSSSIVPKPGGEANTAAITDYYFGHDPFNNRYSVLCSIGVYLEDSKLQISSEHWSFVLKPGRRGSWKKLGPTPPGFRPHIPTIRGLSTNGVIYYLALTDVYESAVVGFDIRSQKFMEMIQVPRRDGDELLERLRNVGLIEYDGKPTLFDQTKLRDKGVVDLWIVEDAVNKKWSRKTLVLQPCQLHLVDNIICFVKGTTQNGKVLLIPEDLFSPFHILCYDLQSNDMRKVEIKGIPDHWFSKEDNAKTWV